MTPHVRDVTGDLDQEVVLVVGVLLRLGAGGARVLAAPIVAQVNARPDVASCKALSGELSMTFIVAEVHGVAIDGNTSKWLARPSYFHRQVSDHTMISDIAVVFQGRLSP